jgi:deoxyribodipyrimidine photo-lyase
MRQMNKTGYMHNRVRMVVANFLVKHLLIDWKKGETYFAQTLVDYDPAQNVGNWQWNASTGIDRFAYGPFRPFNPFQSNKYDSDAEYIKKWVPELKDVPAKDIHRWDEKHDRHDVDYPSPMVDYKKNQEEFKKRYVAVKK